MKALPRPLLFLPLLALPAPGLADEPPHVPGEIIVKVASPSRIPEAEEALARNGCVVEELLAPLDLMRVSYSEDRPATEVSEEIAADPAVEFAHPNYLGEAAFFPNDTHFGSQWHLQNTGQTGGTPGADIQAVPAWDITSGSSSVVVAVLDTGIDRDHPEFFGRLLRGFDILNGDTNPEDDNSHGTSVTGILAANAGNAFAVTGVDHSCKILPIKILNQNGFGTTFSLVWGLISAAGADVISMSIAYPPSPSLDFALQYARDRGSILVGCAGNGGVGDADVTFPGASPLAISVGATAHRDEWAFFSGTGSALDVVAPGFLVRTVAWNTGADTTNPFFTGCSAAVPVVSGIASLLRSLDPTLSHDDVREILTTTAEDQVGQPHLDVPGRDDFFGHGRVNLFEALSAVRVEVDIDVKPGSDDNPINPSSRGVIPVAILGSDSVDVTEVDRGSLALGPLDASPSHGGGGHLEDVNGDDADDLVSHYRVPETGIDWGAEEVCLTGLIGGRTFLGCDRIGTIPAGK